MLYVEKLPVHSPIRVSHRPWRKLWRKTIWVHCWHCAAVVPDGGALELPCSPYPARRVA
jgi:hypothetical protein